MPSLPAARLFRSLVLLLGLILAVAGCARGGERPATAPVVLVSIDGFRWDYLDRYEAPALRRLAAEGVRAEALEPVFPTKTFPNHYTLVTGLYPDHHGIVSNTMYDPAFDASFSLGDREAQADARWWGGEPIWVTAVRQGRRSATYFWPGSEAAVGGVRPTYWKPYDGTVPGEDRVDQVLAWLDLPEGERPDVVTLYFSDVDHAGHQLGPDAPETGEAVRRVDALIGRLIGGLEARGLYDAVNLIVVSDHGMAATSPDRAILLDDHLDLGSVRIVDWNPVVMLYPPNGGEEEVLAALRAVPHLTVYRRNELPERLHYGTHRRVPPIVAIADEGWVVTSRRAYEQNPARFAGGTHGYDNASRDMGALFVARGPGFAQGRTVGPFSAVHVYGLTTHLLGLEPAPHDGSLDAVRDLLR